MAIKLMNNEEIIWKSHEGKNYRKFILFRDSLVWLLIICLIFYVLNNVLSDYISLSFKFKFIFMVISLIVALTFIFINQFLLLMNLYVITNERVIIKSGLLNRRVTSIRLENIIDTKAEQNFIGRLIKSGTIYLFTANDSQNSDDEFIMNVPKFANIDDPFTRHSKIVELLKK